MAITEISGRNTGNGATLAMESWRFPCSPTCRTKEFAGKRYAFCSASCEMFFDQEPQRYLGYTSFYELFDGYDLADFIVENGLLRADGKTLIAQPWLNQEQMWTI